MSAIPSLPSTPESAGPAGDAPWVVCLCAEWCGTCRDYRPLLQEVARAHPQFRFAWVDIEDHADIADAFDVETFPTLLVAGSYGTRFLGPLLPRSLLSVPAPVTEVKVMPGLSRASTAAAAASVRS